MILITRQRAGETAEKSGLRVGGDSYNFSNFLEIKGYEVFGVDRDQMTVPNGFLEHRNKVLLVIRFVHLWAILGISR
jgi:hypothetical protein